MRIDEIKLILSERIDPIITEKLVSEYIEVRKKHYYNDVEKTILHAARFSECSLAAIRYLLDSTIVDLNTLKFEEQYNEITGFPKDTAEKELLALVIPSTLKSIYSIRNKKRITHMKDTVPDFIDSDYVTSVCNWVMSQFLIIVKDLKADSIKDLLNSLISKQIPLIEEFGEDEIKVLKTNLTFKDELLLVLYKYSERLSQDKLNKLLKPNNKSYISTYLAKLDKERFIHLNKDGAIITKLGIEHIEKRNLF